MTDYFSQETIDNGLSYYKTFKARVIIVYLVLPITGIALVIISIILTIRYTIKKRRKKKKAKTETI